MNKIRVGFWTLVFAIDIFIIVLLASNSALKWFLNAICSV